MNERIECGFYHLPETKVFRYAGYECAAWWQEIKVKAGNYPVIAQIERGHVKDFFVSLPGVIVRDNFQSLYCGVAIGSSYDELQNAGKGASYTLWSYYYDAFRSMHTEPGSPWRIDVTKLPNISTCTTCGCYTSDYGKPSLCSRCSIAAKDIRLAVIRKRHSFLLKAVQAAGVSVTRYGNIFDQSIDDYQQSKRESGHLDGYYRKLIVSTVQKLRQYRRLMRDEKANRNALGAMYRNGCLGNN